MADRYREDPQAQSHLDDMMGDLLGRILDASETDAKRLVPILTGELRSKIGSRKLSATHGQVYADTEYAAAVESGHINARSKRHIAAQPYLRPAVYKNRGLQ